MDEKRINHTALDIELSSSIIFESLCQSYGEQTVLGVLKYQEKEIKDLMDEDYRRELLQLLEGIQ